jgi:hypothetical protein
MKTSLKAENRWILGLLGVALISGVALVAAASPASVAEEAPPWLTLAASARTPAYDNKVPAVVLVDEGNSKVEEDGRVTTTSRYAVRILTNEGRHRAIARVSYLTDTGKVRDMRAWLIRPSEQVKKYGKDQTLDIAGAPNASSTRYASS